MEDSVNVLKDPFIFGNLLSFIKTSTKIQSEGNRRNLIQIIVLPIPLLLILDTDDFTTFVFSPPYQISVWMISYLCCMFAFTPEPFHP